VPDVIRATESLCPVCLTRAPARLLSEGGRVMLEGRCAAHGEWRTVVWSGPPSFESWCGPEPIPAARQTCTAVFEVTQRCDLGCPVCFAEASAGSGAAADPTVDEIAGRLRGLFAAEGEVNLQLSGGEPTTRDDLPEIVAAARGAGFTFVQLNTNGLRLAAEDGYAESLRAVGLASVFLQFDGVSDDTYRALRGRPLLAQKVRAVERCAEAGLAVVLVPTVAPGVNDGELGGLVRFAASWPGVVRGLHLQPMSYFGRYPGAALPGAPPRGRPRLTLPELLRALEDQTGGEVLAEHFSPSCCEHVRCSFRARYWVRDGGVLEPLRSAGGCCGSESASQTASALPAAAPPCGAPPCGPPPAAGDVSRRAVAATSRQWSRREPEPCGCGGAQDACSAPSAGAAASAPAQDDLSRFLDDAGRILAISGMLFQDAWSIDMERIDRCCVQVVTAVGERAPEGLVPFCLWNLTSASGERLHPRC
jgi:uncharacterized radical SAM superfamily Fe-S cluster-containing enzyme